MSNVREIVYRFLSLPTHRQLQIALKVGLWSKEEDWNLVARSERELTIFSRAKERGLIDALAEEIESFTCPRCGATSYNPNDVREGYCGRCHWCTGDPVLGKVEGKERSFPGERISEDLPCYCEDTKGESCPACEDRP